MRQRFSLVGADLRKPTRLPGIQPTLRDHVIRIGVSRDMPVYSPSVRLVIIQPGQAQAK